MKLVGSCDRVCTPARRSRVLFMRNWEERTQLERGGEIDSVFGYPYTSFSSVITFAGNSKKNEIVFERRRKGNEMPRSRLTFLNCNTDTCGPREREREKKKINHTAQEIGVVSRLRIEFRPSRVRRVKKHPFAPSDSSPREERRVG